MKKKKWTLTMRKRHSNPATKLVSVYPLEALYIWFFRFQNVGKCWLLMIFGKKNIV